MFAVGPAVRTTLGRTVIDNSDDALSGSRRSVPDRGEDPRPRVETLTRGCNIWVVCGGRHNRIIFFSLQNLMNSVEIWEA